MRVHHLDCATMCPFGGPTLHGVHHLVGHCLLVEAPGGLVLVDTGVGSRAAETLPRGFKVVAGPDLSAEATAVGRIRALGFDPRDVRDVVLTHLDLDHAGGLADFPEARVHVQADEHDEATRRPGLHAKLRYVPAQWAHGPRWVLHPTRRGEAWKGFEAVRELEGLPPELLLVPLGGHSRGHQAVAVESDGPAGKRWLLHGGDLWFHRGRMRGEPVPFALAAFERGVAYDAALVRSNQARVRELARGHADVTVFSAHDASEFEALARPA